MATVERTKRSNAMFHRPVAFWFGAVAVAVGGVLYFPRLFGSADMDDMLLAGVAVTLFGIETRRGASRRAHGRNSRRNSRSCPEA